jgi:hypothetical protein
VSQSIFPSGVSTTTAWVVHGYYSTGSVREALMRLAEAGMVEFERNRGFWIVTPGPQDIAEIFALRMLLEVPAARRAAQQPSADLTSGLRGEPGSGGNWRRCA